MSRSRAFIFTINNWTVDHVFTLSRLEAQYIVYGKEVGAQGTPHLQGYVYFKTQRTLQSVIKKLPGAHVEIRRGTHSEAKAYCEKDGNVTEIGEEPEQNGGDSMSSRLEKNKRLRENSLQESLDLGDVSFLQLEKLKKCKLVLEQEGAAYTAEDVRGLWIHGPPGTGKTHRARELDSAFFIKSQNKWWDGYAGEDTVVLDDLDKSGSCLGHHLKIWADKWSCTGEVKGGTVNLKHKLFIVTSNYTPEELWPDDVAMSAAISRRFKFEKHQIKYT